MNNYRVFHGLNNITGSAAALAQAERSLGIDSKCVGFSSAITNLQPDIYAQPTNYPPLNYALFEEFVEQFDIFVFYHGMSFAGESLADIPILKKMGKKIIFYFRGCDICQSKLAIDRNAHCACSECYPMLCNSNIKHAKETAEKYADSIWVSTADLLEHVENALLVPQSVCLKDLHYNELPFPDDEKIKIAHSPSSFGRKGTEFVLQAIEDLKTKLNIELILISGLPWKKAHEMKLNAHFAIDQLRIGWYGVSSVEFMALGKPTICFLNDYYLERSKLSPPIINANINNIKDVIYEMCIDKESYLETIKKGRKYVEDMHDSRIIANKTVGIYNSLF